MPPPFPPPLPQRPRMPKMPRLRLAVPVTRVTRLADLPSYLPYLHVHYCTVLTLLKIGPRFPSNHTSHTSQAIQTSIYTSLPAETYHRKSLSALGMAWKNSATLQLARRPSQPTAPCAFAICVSRNPMSIFLLPAMYSPR